MKDDKWVGWVWFAAIMMIVMGAFNAVEGFAALFRGQFYVVGPENVLVFDLTTWGWVHLVLGVLVLLAGIALFSGAPWARLTAVILAVVNAVGQLAYVSVQPVWSTIVIALCVIVVWAVVVHVPHAGAEGGTRKG